MWNRALVEGLERSRRIWLLLPLYLFGLILGLVQTWPLGMAALNGGLRNPFLDRLVAGGADALGDLFISNTSVAAPAGTWLALSLPLLWLFSLAYNFFSGGMLSAAVGTRPFWAGCRRTFWSFCALGIILMLFAAIIAAGVSSLGAALGLNATVITIIVFVLLQLLNLVGEYARAVAVARDRLNPFVIFGAAVAFCARRFVGVLLLGVFGLLLNVVLVALYLLINPSIGNSPLAIVLQQFCVLGWLWVKFVRLLWALCYVRASDSRARPIVAESPFEPFGGVQTIG